MTTQLLHNLLTEFMSAKDYPISVYNEISLQHELGLYLRARLLGLGYSVLFEKNVKELVSVDCRHFLKKEIDLVLSNGIEKFAVELKFPRDGQYPDQMVYFLKDIAFIDQLIEAGFDGGAVATLVDDPLFYSNNKNSEYPYSIFRSEHIVIRKGMELKYATGKEKNKCIYRFQREHKASWYNLTASWKRSELQRYYIFSM